MFVKLKNRINLTLVTFLGLFSLLINGILFGIMADYNYRNFVNLAEAHIEQQQQYFFQKISVAEESLRLFLAEGKFQDNLKEKSWSAVHNEVVEYVLSSAYVEGFSIYIEKNSTYQRVVNASINFPEIDAEFMRMILEEQGSFLYAPQWLLRREYVGDTRCFSLIYPIYSDKNQLLGIALLDFSLAQMTGMESNDESFFLREKMLIYSRKDFWSSMSIPLDESFKKLIHSSADGIIKDRKHIMSLQQIPQSKDIFIFEVPVNFYPLLLPLGLALLLNFGVSLVIFLFISCLVGKSITDPLSDLQKNLNHTIQG